MRSSALDFVNISIFWRLYEKSAKCCKAGFRLVLGKGQNKFKVQSAKFKVILSNFNLLLLSSFGEYPASYC